MVPQATKASPAALLAALMATAAAGCLGGGAPGLQEHGDLPAWAREAVVDTAADERHDHRDPGDHRGLTTANFEVLGHDPLVTDYHGRPAGGYYCGALAETEGRDLAVYHSFSSDVALVVVDVTDRHQPMPLGELILPLTHVYDAAVTQDGRFAVLATDPYDTGPDVLPEVEPPAPPVQQAGPAVPPALRAAADGSEAVRDAAHGGLRPLSVAWRDPCGTVHQGPERFVPYDSGVVLVDLRDPSEPAIADYEPQPVVGPHGVSTATIRGVPYVAAATTNLVHGSSYYGFFTIESTAAGPQLVPFGTFTGQGLATEDLDLAVATSIGWHVDAVLQEHPVTGQVLAYLADWNGGLVIAELVAPGRIERVGDWRDHDGRADFSMTGQWHSARPLEGLRDGRHITLLGQEALGRPSGRPSGLTLLVDTTDPAHPRPVARWTLPVDVQWDGLFMWSPHYADLVGDTLFVSMYHGGLWAVDASEEHWPDLPAVGVFMPDEDTPTPVADPIGWTPDVLDVNHLDDGTLVVLDAMSGAYTLRFREDDPRVPPAPPWRDPIEFT